MWTCHFCGASVDEQFKIMRSSICSTCGKDLKICRNCRFYKSEVRWSCTETIDEPVSDKERANFCAYFQYRSTRTTDCIDVSERAREDLKRLFQD